jgi:hypothetical protein
MANAIEARLDKYTQTDNVDRFVRIIDRETGHKRTFGERRASSRVPGELVHFIPASWLGLGASESYRVKLLAR